jgi:hypothetical protein
MSDTITTLTKEFTDWCTEHNYPLMSADELLAETDENDDYLVKGQNRNYLNEFIRRWDASQEQPQFVQDITEDYGIVMQGETVEDTGLGIYMKYGSNEYCEFREKDNCSDDGILWQGDDMGSPYFCTEHNFPQEQLGYEFVEL